MNKTEKEYYSKCWARTYYNTNGYKLSYPTCVYFDTKSGKCTLNYCYRKKGAKA